MYVAITIAMIYKKINHGILIFFLPSVSVLFTLLYTTATINESGIIHKALMSLVVVATCNANSLLVAAAPTTDEVSCIAIAHQYPNSVSVSFNKSPIGGKINSAIAFKVNIVPKATVMELSLALITGPKAAIALPPHIAVPPEMRVLVCTSTFNNLPIHKPNPIVKAIENKVNINPVLPAINASWRFIPNPKPTTEACNKIFVNILLCCINGLPIVKATTNPQNKAIAGERKGTIKRRIINIVSLVLCDNLSLIIECCVGKKQRFYRFTNQ